MPKLSSLYQTCWFWWIALLGIVLYNNWLLGLFLNSLAIGAGATSSELAVAGQPHYQLFRALDIASGCCFLLTCFAVSKLSERRWARLLLVLLVLLLGISTITESLLFPLTCSSALNAACAKQELAHMVSLGHHFHILESVASYALVFLLPLIVLFGLRPIREFGRLRKVSYVLVGFMVIWAAESIYQMAHNATKFGYEQHAFFFLFSYWYYLAIQAARSTLAHGRSSTGAGNTERP